MRIVRVIARLNVGGPARHVVWLTQAMAAAGHHAVLVAGSVPRGEDDMTYFARERGVEPVSIPEMSRELSVRDVAVVGKLLRLFWRERPDVIHTHTAKAGAVGRAAALLYRLAIRLPFAGDRARPAVVHTYHGHVFHSYYGRFRTAAFLTIERVLARLVTDRIVVISPQQLEEIHGRFRVGHEGQFSIVRLGLDLAAFRGSNERRGGARAALGIDERELAVGIVGRLTEIKNHRLFLRAAANLLQRRMARTGPHIRFLIVGGGRLREDLEREARALGLQERVTFMGDRKDAEAIYPALDLVVLSSLNEGTPLTLIEAMAAGRPTVSTAVGGVVDLAGPRQGCEPPPPSGTSVHSNGVLVHDKDPATLAAALDYLIDRPEQASAMGHSGSEFVAAMYTVKRLTSELTQLYAELVPSGPPGRALELGDSPEPRSTSTYSRSRRRA